MAKEIDFENEVTGEMFEALVSASLYGEDTTLAIQKIAPKGWTKQDVKQAIRYMLSQKERMEEFKKVLVELEKTSLIDHDQDTIMLVYKRLMEKAAEEKKYEVVTRILREIRQLKAIENDQMKFEVVITVQDSITDKDDTK